MDIKITLLLLLILLFTSGCYATLKGKVIDGETGEPIEGAVAMAEWTKTKGIGNTYTVSARVVETMSDKEGTIEISGCWCPFTDKPDLTIYKKGYVAWNSRIIFPHRKKREGFEWRDDQVFSLEKFGEGYLYNEHLSFIRSSINSTIGYEKKKIIIKAFEWETDMKLKERRRK